MTIYYILAKDEGFTKVFHSDFGPLNLKDALIQFGKLLENGENPILVKQVDLNELQAIEKNEGID